MRLRNGIGKRNQASSEAKRAQDPENLGEAKVSRAPPSRHVDCGAQQLHGDVRRLRAAQRGRRMDRVDACERVDGFGTRWLTVSEAVDAAAATTVADRGSQSFATSLREYVF